MRHLRLTALLVLTIAPAATAQRFAPAQPRAAAPASRPARVLPIGTSRLYLGGDGLRPIGTGLPLPMPMGLERPGSNLGAYNGRSFTNGVPVTIPPLPAGTGARLYSYTDESGHPVSVMYNPGTGAAITYDQSVTYSLRPLAPDEPADGHHPARPGLGQRDLRQPDLQPPAGPGLGAELGPPAAEPGEPELQLVPARRRRHAAPLGPRPPLVRRPPSAPAASARSRTASHPPDRQDRRKPRIPGQLRHAYLNACFPGIRKKLPEFL